MTDRFEIFRRAENYKTIFVGLHLAVPFLMHPEVPLVKFHHSMGMPSDFPVHIYRQDGTMRPAESSGVILNRLTGLPGAGLDEDLLPLAAMHGAIRLGDDLIQSGLMKASVPLLQFARHFRNACAHGNRWHFTGAQPKYPAELRGRVLDASLHGSKAMYGWLGPGDYLDYLDDLAALLRTDHNSGTEQHDQ